MDKIKALLEQIGASKELADQICEQFTRWAEEKEKSLNEEFQNRLENAKTVCIEEVEKEKHNLAKKVEIFLESKSASIERAIAKQRAMEESKALNTLKEVKAITEGIEVKGGISSDKYEAAVRDVAKLKRKLTTLQESRDSAIAKANEANKIAANVLKKNQILEGKARQAGLLSEQKKDKKTLTELAKEQKSEQPKSTRRTLTESQTPAKKVVEPKAQPTDIRSTSINDIAGMVDDIA